MPAPPIQVFIASPGDLAIERRVFKDTIDELNKGFGPGADMIWDLLQVISDSTREQLAVIDGINGV